MRYSHEIDPRTGWPVDHDLAAAYVIDSEAARADALATAFMVLGPEATMELVSQLTVGVFLIRRDDDGEFRAISNARFDAYLD